MRKIEQEMVNAVNNRQNWQGANTAVFIETCGNPFGTRAEIYLHGNHIADYWYGDGVISDNPLYEGSRVASLEVDTRTLKAYPTNTTMSRLRALGANVYRKKGKPMLDGQEV